MNRLIIIPPSHYCEKVRWALNLAQLPFVQEAHAPLFHISAVKKAGGQRTTPTLITDHGIYDDSADILSWIQNHPQSQWKPYGHDCFDELREWENYFGDQLGPHTRRFAYSILFKLPKKTYLSSIIDGVPGTERRLAHLFWPMIKFLMRKSMNIDEASVARSKSKIDACFNRVAEALAEQEVNEGGQKYLVGQELSAADLSFATLAAPALLPKEYGAMLPSLDALPLHSREQTQQYRQHPAGRFALAIYEELDSRVN